MIRTTKLELMRSGPEHNQLLSPLTPYIALCGPAGPQTVHMPYEHRQLLSRLARLRYAENGCDVPAAQRESELREIGEAVGRVLGAVPGLQSALDRAPKEGVQLVHVRLALSALELGMVPFEAAIAPDNFPGSGAPLLLRTPTLITREVRRSRPISVRWNRKPRILFAFATPGGLAPVPARDHLKALRRAIEPFVPIKDDDRARVREVRKQLTVLPEASLKTIADACRCTEYTHVHILAHGAPFEEAGSDRYGVALHSAGKAGGVDIVDGERLAIALSGAGLVGEAKLPPTVVSLATCDSGTVDSVLAPGGSIAHELHEAGIPWVIASQFPLWMRASTIAVEELYSGLLYGADPRRVLYELRQLLRTEVPQTHDWASLVVYAISPWDFEEQIERFYDRQVRARISVMFKRMDELVKSGPLSREADREMDELGAAIRAEHATWIKRVSRGDDKAAYSEALGMQGASEKRIAIAYDKKRLAAQSAGEKKTANPAEKRAAKQVEKQAEKDALRAYEASRDAYLGAIREQPTNHWVITQFLSIVTTPALMPDGEEQEVREKYRDWWTAAQQIARWQLTGASGEERAWALSTLLELDLLGSVYGGGSYRVRASLQRITDACRGIVDTTGRDSFPVASTRRQLIRYRDVWHHPRWKRLATEAIKVFDEKP